MNHKLLYIARHAKSSWDNIALQDRERPLIEKGIQRTNIIADYMSVNNCQPDLIVSSQAIRAYETARIIAERLHYPVAQIQQAEDLYMTDLDNVIEFVNSIPSDINQLILVGHNPTFTNLVNQFLPKKIVWLPTSGLACFRFEISRWEDIDKVKPSFVYYITPKLLEG